MFIIPYVYTEKQTKTHTIKKIHLLCEGDHLWEETDIDIEKDILEPNDLFSLKPPILKDNITWIHIDHKKTNINSMFNWREIPLINTNATLSWRTFIFIDNNTNEQWLTCPENTMLSNMKLRDIIKEIQQYSGV